MNDDTAPEARVRLERLHRSYTEGTRQHEVLRDITADFSAGETVALRGRSGSGKSTLLNLIAGIDTPDGGRVLIDRSEERRVGERV